MKRVYLSLVAFGLIVVVACPAGAADDQAAVTKIVAEHLKVDPSTVDIDGPLSKVGKGADALDVVEIHMAIGRIMHVDIRDKTVAAVIGTNDADDYPARTTVRKLTQMVAIARQAEPWRPRRQARGWKGPSVTGEARCEVPKLARPERFELPTSWFVARSRCTRPES
jgi:acyl carrier protein